MEQLLPWFALKHIPGIGNHLYRRLIERFETPSRVFEASVNELAGIDGVSGRLASAIKGFRSPDTVKREIDRVLKRGYGVVTQGDAAFPRLLLEIPDPPPFLYVNGSLKGNDG